MHSNPPFTTGTAIERRYETITEHLDVNGHAFAMRVVLDVNTLLDAITPDQFNVDERLPFWAELWPSSIALARHCLGTDLHGTSVLELGTGLGLAGIAAAKAGARVVMTDYEHDALDFARRNAASNLAVEELARIEFRHLDWRTWDGADRFDMILGADVVYDRANFPLILSIIKTGLLPSGAAVLSDPGRSMGSDFVARAKEHGLRVQHSCSEVEYRTRCTRVDLYRLDALPVVGS